MRYLIMFVVIGLFSAGLRLAAGQHADFAYDAVFALGIVAAQFLARRWQIARSQVPRRKGYAYPVFAIVFLAALLTVSAYRLYAAVGSGRLLVSIIPADSFVSWSDRPLGFVVMTLVYLLTIALLTGMVWVMVLELKERYQSRHEAAALNSGTLLALNSGTLY